jgi:hypothetical protein
MNKSLLMTQYKELYGGFYIRNNGRWYWKANQETQEVGPISGFWLREKINEAKNKPIKTIEFAKIEEPKVEEVKVEEPKVEKPKKPSSKKPVHKKTTTETTVEVSEENKEEIN